MRRNQAFTLMEVVITLGVLVTTLLAVIVMISQTLKDLRRDDALLKAGFAARSWMDWAEWIQHRSLLSESPFSSESGNREMTHWIKDEKSKFGMLAWDAKGNRFHLIDDLPPSLCYERYHETGVDLQDDRVTSDRSLLVVFEKHVIERTLKFQSIVLHIERPAHLPKEKRQQSTFTRIMSIIP